MFDGRFRSGVDRAVKPVGGALRRTGLSPDHLTAFGVLMAIATAWAIGTGRLGLGLGLLIGSAVLDLLDGALAKASGRSSIRGAFFDSVTDRVSDSFVLGGFAWYLMDHRRGHIALLPMAILGVSLLISYERAKADALGFDAKVGLMERAERVVVLCAALAFSFLMLPLLWLMFALTSLTAVQRFVRVWRQATAAGQGPPPAARPIFVRRASYIHDARTGEPIAVAARWRAWREANGWVPRSERPAQRSRYGSRASSGGSAAARWHERRQARLARLSPTANDDPDGAPARRGGSRRP